MDAGFFGSKFFVIAIVAGGIVLATGAALYNVGSGFIGDDVRGCDAPSMTGPRIDATPRDERVGDEERRVSYALPADALVGGLADLCVAVGEVVVTQATGDAAEVVFTIRGPSTAVDRTQVRAEFTQRDGGLGLAAWEAVAGRTGTLVSRRSVDVTLEVRLPQTGAFDLRATSDVGDVRATSLLLGNATLSTDVGDVVATALDVQGNVTVTTDVGQVTLQLDSVQSGKIRASSDVNDVEVRLPQRADVGYDVHATTDVGDATVEIGPTERFESRSDGPGDDVQARSQGYATKPTQVVVEATSDVGDVVVKAS